MDVYVDMEGDKTKMDKAIKYNGKWKQTSSDNMDAVLSELGMSWTVRKVAGLMDVYVDMEAQSDGILSSLKTKLKNTDTLMLYSGVTKTKGLSDDEDVEITVSFDENGDLQQTSTIFKGGKKKSENSRKYEIKNGQMIITQSCNGKTGTRTFSKL